MTPDPRYDWEGEREKKGGDNKMGWRINKRAPTKEDTAALFVGLLLLSFIVKAGFRGRQIAQEYRNLRKSYNRCIPPGRVLLSLAMHHMHARP